MYGVISDDDGNVGVVLLGVAKCPSPHEGTESDDNEQEGTADKKNGGNPSKCGEEQAEPDNKAEKSREDVGHRALAVSRPMRATCPHEFRFSQSVLNRDRFHYFFSDNVTPEHFQ